MSYVEAKKQIRELMCKKIGLVEFTNLLDEIFNQCSKETLRRL